MAFINSHGNESIWTNINDESYDHGERNDIHKAYIKQIEMAFSIYKITTNQWTIKWN